MNLKTVTGKINELSTSALVMGVFTDVSAKEPAIAELDSNLKGSISHLVERGEIKGEWGEITSVYSLGYLPAERIVIVGLGKKDKFDLDTWRRALGELGRYLQNRGIVDLVILPPESRLASISTADIAQATVEGILLGTYSFDKYLTKETAVKKLEELTFVIPGEDENQEVVERMRRGNVVAEVASLARDLTNEPSNQMTPSTMAEVARDLAERYNLDLSISGENEMKKMGMGGILGVSQGSCQSPQFIVLSHKGQDREDIDLALLGKGITFDSGGISIKPADKMGEMKTDMAGGASVMAAIAGISRLGARINATAIVPAVENMPSGHALKPGDILTTMSGKTVEIVSTDAEGRVILADAITYAKTQVKARHIIDVATLTGACIVALGKVCTGAFTNNQRLANQVLNAADRTGEPIWQMPMLDEYKKLNQSDVADLKNAGSREAGAISAAQFLAEFAGDTPWVHLDIAGTSTADKRGGYLVKGATGVPVRTLIELALTFK